MCSFKHVFLALIPARNDCRYSRAGVCRKFIPTLLFLSTLATRWPQLAIVCHDDACHLKLFALQHRRSTAVAERLAAMDYIVDRFHAPGHCGEYCAQHCLPTIEDNKRLLGTFPTEIAEIVNSEMTPLGHTIHHMGKFFAQLVVSECTDVHNLSRLLALRDKQRADAKKRGRGTIQPSLRPFVFELLMNSSMHTVSGKQYRQPYERKGNIRIPARVLCACRRFPSKFWVTLLSLDKTHGRPALTGWRAITTAAEAMLSPFLHTFTLHLYKYERGIKSFSDPEKDIFLIQEQVGICQKIEGMIVVFCLSWSFIVHYIVNIVHAHHHGSVALWGLLGEWCAHRIFMGYCRKEYHGCIKSTTMMRW